MPTSIPVDIGVEELQTDEQKVYDGKRFPFMVKPRDTESSRSLQDWCQWVKENQKLFSGLLFNYGALAFRGFPIREPEDFDKFVKSFGYGSFPYVGGAAPRKVVVGNVFTANEAPPKEPIPFHHEMAQVPDFPKILFFCCDIAPSNGGQTPLVPSNLIYRTMQERDPSFVKRLEEQGVRYTRILPNGDDPTSPIGRGWQSTFLTDNKEAAEASARQQGTEFEWLPNGCMKTTTKVLPAIREDPRSGKKTWFNSVIAAYMGWTDCRNDRKKAVCFADGSFMPESSMATLDEVFNGLAVAITYQKGDVFIVDNRTVLHARRTFTPPRRILACLCKDEIEIPTHFEGFEQ